MKNNKSLKVLAIIGVIFSIAFANCKKGHEEIVQQFLTPNSYYIQNSNLKLSNRLIVNPSNYENQYDTVGHYHNLYLDMFAINQIWNAASNNNIYEENRNFCDTFMDLTGLMSGYLNSDINLIVETTMLDLTANYSNNSEGLNQFMMDNSISLTSRNYILEISDVISDLGSFNNLSIRGAATDAVGKIKEIEALVINNTSIGVDEKRMILSAASVARYSLVYAASAFTVSGNPWVENEDIVDPDEVSSEIWVIVGADWEKIGREDFKGAASGGIAALAASVSTGGAFAVAVLAAGGGSSAAELLDQLVYGPAWLIWL
jgi:hypothetical protein